MRENFTKSARAQSSCTLAQVGNCIISAWHGPADTDAMRALSDLACTLEKTQPSGFALVVMLQPGLAMPDAGERARLEQFYKQHGERLRAVASVVLGTGFWASGMRGVLTALAVTERRAYPTRVFGESAEAVSWLGTVPGFALLDAAKLRLKLTEIETNGPRPAAA